MHSNVLNVFKCVDLLLNAHRIINTDQVILVDVYSSKVSTDYYVYKCFTLFLCITIKNRLNDNKAYKTLKLK